MKTKNKQQTVRQDLDLLQFPKKSIAYILFWGNTKEEKSCIQRV
ncbi:hypothetical protein CS5676_0061 [Clostridium phage phiCs5676-1]|nr:hypothetical protein CS5676_0061 [Clostridium phage phiCs5676-1]